MASTAHSCDTATRGESRARVRWSSSPHRRRILLIRGTAALVFFAFAILGIVIGPIFTLGYLLVIAGIVGWFVTTFVLEGRFPPPSEYVPY